MPGRGPPARLAADRGQSTHIDRRDPDRVSERTDRPDVFATANSELRSEEMA
ncbi:hypothetical protein HNP84_001480 [Thermocatellispora tengchongensis]|uniref:Uncharacterized protein n=1 Tax=Thermocatellispora tengchongensis TaxID=1073253 RepID=A0A840P3E4_9ACTN|nr:hypothetical protein [Thermocatellispora tengchongensis]